MLLQSHAGEIHLLPALPAAWPDGEFHGLRERGGVEVDVTWAKGRITSATLRPKVDGTYRIRVGQELRIVSLRAGIVHQVKLE
jgi:alpha-L-fucosidase 2